jgi:hypothetical protein
MQTSGRVIEQTHAIEDVSDIGTLSGRDQVISWDVRRYLHSQGRDLEHVGMELPFPEILASKSIVGESILVLHEQQHLPLPLVYEGALGIWQPFQMRT